MWISLVDQQREPSRCFLPTLPTNGISSLAQTGQLFLSHPQTHTHTHAHPRRPVGMEHGHGEFLSSVAVRSRHGSRCTVSGRPGPKALAGATAAAHRQQGCQKEVRRGSRALGGATAGPARLPSGLGRKRALFSSSREERERQRGRAGQLLPVFRGRRTKPSFLQALEPSARPGHWLVLSQRSWHGEVW